jgi:hypothetical protein
MKPPRPTGAWLVSDETSKPLPIWRGTESSNPSPSATESVSAVPAMASRRKGPAFAGSVNLDETRENGTCWLQDGSPWLLFSDFHAVPLLHALGSCSISNRSSRRSNTTALNHDPSCGRHSTFRISTLPRAIDHAFSPYEALLSVAGYPASRATRSRSASGTPRYCWWAPAKTAMR